MIMKTQKNEKASVIFLFSDSTAAKTASSHTHLLLLSEET